MTQPQPGAKISAELGWRRLTHTMAKEMPKRLAYTRDVRHGIRTLIKGGGK